jgi:hypothetical protein
MTNTACLTQHDTAITTYQLQRARHSRRHITDAELERARVEYERACREFERTYRNELAPQ